MHIFKNIYFNKKLFVLAAVLAALFIASYFISPLFIVIKILLFTFLLVLFVESLILFRFSEGISASRQVPEKLSNGDSNRITIQLQNGYPLKVQLEIIDELPLQFQERNFLIRQSLQAGEEKQLHYTVKPTERGVYSFGTLNIFVSLLFLLVQRRYRFSSQAKAAVYPSFIQMRRYELFAVSNRLSDAGIKKIRQIGHTMEFDRIRNYVPGDDYRSVNWKATARKAKLMVNQFQDEKSQQVYALLDMGRVMKMPFEGMSLLDYAINSSLVLANVALHKQDKAGIITFSDHLNTILAASRNYNQLSKILELLHKQQTAFRETDYESLYSAISYKLKQRSLLLLFTNFESISAMQRQVLYLRNIAKRHLLVVIFFENTELDHLRLNNHKTTEDLYIKTVAAKFVYEKKQIVHELSRYGIQHILTKPQDLTINTLNKYLELKSRGLI